MGKTRVHLLAKELGIETKDLIAQLDRLGLRGRKAQSSLEDDDVARLRAALAAQEKPHVHVGEEKIVADRVVKGEDESLGEIQARETIVERRVRANVIRRRTSRTEVMTEAGAKSAPQPEAFIAPAEEPISAIEDLIATTPSFEEDSALTATAPEAEFSHREEAAVEPLETKEESAPIETRSEEAMQSRSLVAE
ncbi:MAG: translation initiation factor IF-2 N-terminal domain-containing protein, partial [Candidatus Binatia bacterium]